MTLVRENEDGGTVNEETSLLAGETGRHLVHGASVGDQHVDEEEGKESWNSSTVNTWRFVCTNLTLMIMGMENASIGVSCYRSQDRRAHPIQIVLTYTLPGIDSLRK